MIKNPVKPILTAFLSYSANDLKAVTPLINGLREAYIEVIFYQENEQFGADINQWIISSVAECDCIIVIISRNSLRKKSRVADEIGLAMTLFQKKGKLVPEIVPVMLDGCRGTTKFQPRKYYSSEPIGPPIIWKDINCIMLNSDSPKVAIEKFVELLAPKTLIITDSEDLKQKPLFEAAMCLYKNLLPDERERDQEADIADWINESWNNNDEPENNSEWIHTLAVHHIDEKVIGILWCSVHKTTGIGFISFWGLLASYRAYNRGVVFATEVITLLKQYVPDIHALLFAAERVEWNVLDEFLSEARQILEKHPAIKGKDSDWFSALADPIGNEPSAISQMLDSISVERQTELVEQMRRFRRFSLYAGGASYNKKLSTIKSALMGFAKRDRDVNGSENISDLMADFVQPPIRLPVTSFNDCHLWLFALVFDDYNLSAAKAIDWIYDVFLKDSLGAGRTKLAGWNEYMTRFKNKWRDSFADEAELTFLRLHERFLPYKIFLTEIKKHSLHRKVMGKDSESWSIEL